MATIAIVGLGRLGCPMAAVFAAAGHTVVGVEVSEAHVRALNAGEPPVIEPGLEEMLARSEGRLSATHDYAAAVARADATFIVVPTPSGPDGGFSLDYVLPAVREVGVALRGASRRHVVVITSTVMPGSTLGPIVGALEESSGLQVGAGVGLCYSPEFIALGSVINDLTHPDMILVGESDPASGQVLADILHTVTGPDVPVARMDPTSAEVAKLAVNTFVTTKISYANMLAEICERLPGADAKLVTAAVGMDSRIGPKYLTPGAPYGGPCFPRDNLALAALARRLGASGDIAEATDAINRRQVDRVVDIVLTRAAPVNHIGVLGLSYKPGTPVRDESFGVALASRFAAQGFSVVAWDPTCAFGPRSQMLEQVATTDSLSACVAQSEVLVVATPWPQLAELPALLTPESHVRAVVDCWSLLDDASVPGQLLVRIGRDAGAEMAMA